MRKLTTQLHLRAEDLDESASRDLHIAAGSLGGTEANLTILVIDDEPSSRRLIENSLEEEARVLQLFDIPAEGELDLTGIDVVVLDYKLPSRDGLVLLREIRELSEDTPVIFMTGYGDSEVARKAIDLGANEYVPKPFEPVVLRRVVNRLTRALDEEEREAVAITREQQAREFRATDQRGETFSGRLENFDARSAVVSVDRSGRFQEGDVISGATVLFGSSKIDFTTGKIEQVVSFKSVDQLTIRFTREWLVVDRGVEPFGGRFQCFHSEEGDRDREELPGNLRLAAIDLATIFREIHDDVTSFEVSLDRYSPKERMKVEEKFLRYAKGTMYQRLTEAVVQFEEASRVACSMGYQKLFKKFSRKLLYPHVLSSPFMSRIVERPIGIPGDFDMLGQILGKRFRGGSLFGRLINEWILSNPATDAYRHRVQILEDQTRRVVRNCRESGRSAKVLSMASGVAYEVQRYVQNPEDGCQVDFTLVDFSDETLAEARRQFEANGQPDGKEVSVAFEQSSVIELANNSRSSVARGSGWVPDGKYDVVYCAGLFDYLSDRMIVSVTRYLNNLVAKGGVLVVCNYTNQNPFAQFMGLVLDWELIYRSENQLEELMQKAVGEGNFQLTTDKHGVEAYGIADH